MKRISKKIVFVAITLLMLLSGLCYFLWSHISKESRVKYVLKSLKSKRYPHAGICVDPTPGEDEKDFLKQFGQKFEDRGSR